MQTGDWFVIAVTVLELGACISYAIRRDWDGLFWLGAVTMNLAVLAKRHL